MATTYYAVCDANGPISVRLTATTADAAVAEFSAADTRAWIDDARTDAEDDLGLSDCADLSESEFDAALRAAGCEPVTDLDAVHNAHAGTTAHLDGGWYLWRRA